MAKLTDQLSTDMSVKPVREPPAPSTGLATLFNAAGDMMNVFDRVNKRNAEEERQAAQLKRQQKEDARKDVENRIPYLVVKASEAAVDLTNSVNSKTVKPEDIFNNNGVTDPQQQELNNSFDAVFSKLEAQQAAVAQGKLPRISLNSAMNRMYLELVNQYPDFVGKINEEFKKQDFQPSRALQAGVDMQKVHESERDSALKWQENMFTKGMEVLSPEISSTMSREDIIAHGAAATNTEYKLEQQTKLANLALTNKNISEAERKSLEEDRDNGITQTLVVDAYNNSNPVIKSLQSLMLSIQKAPLSEQKARWEQLGPQYEMWASNYKAQALAKASAAGMKDTGSLATQIDQLVNRGRSMFTGEMSLAQANYRALQSLQTSAKVDMAKAMPAFFALQQAGIKASDIESFSTGLAQNPKLQEALRKEISGFSTEFGEEKASTRMMNIVRILKGEATIDDFTATQAREKMPTLYFTAKDTARKYLNGESDDPKVMLNATGAVISAARTISPASGLDAWTIATGGVAGRNTRQALLKALKDPVNNDLAEANIQGAKAASAKILDGMRPTISQYGKSEFDQWHIVLKDGRAFAEQRKVPLGGYETVNGKQVVKKGFGNQPMPQDMKRFIDAWNTNIDNIIALNPYDPSGVKNAKPIDIQRFYGENRVSGAFVSTPEINANKEIDTQFKALEEAFTQVPDLNTNVSVVGNIGAAEGTGKDPNSSAVSGFLNGTWLGLMKKYESGLVKDKTDQEILAMRNDKKLRDRMIQAYAQENATILAQNNIPATVGNLNLMHLFGGGEGPKVLKADPNTPIDQLVRPIVLKQNPWMRGKTVAEIRQIRKA